MVKTHSAKSEAWNKTARWSKKNRRPRQRTLPGGALAVEVALTSIILFLFVLAGLEFGRMNMLRHTLNNAAYEGARKALVPKATDQEIRTAVEKMLRTVAANNPRILIHRANGTVTVQVELDASRQGWMVPLYFRSRTLRSSVTLAEEGR
jgi:Flp pilus assembly protein TadG